MADAFDPAELLILHHRLMAGDRLASDALVRLMLRYLVDCTKRTFARRYEQFAIDGTTDAILRYCSRPSTFDPSGKAPLEACLLRAAWCKTCNSILSERRLKEREQEVVDENPEISVAFDPVARNIKREESRREAADIEEILSALSDADREFFTLQLQGERQTKVFAKLLNMDHLPVSEQRIVVKQNKDRIRGSLKRKGLLP